MGLLSGISLSLWMAFGTPKPPLPTLPVSIEGCATGFNINTSQIVNVTINAATAGDK